MKKKKKKKMKKKKKKKKSELSLPNGDLFFFFDSSLVTDTDVELITDFHLPISIFFFILSFIPSISILINFICQNQ